jgi:hypothetical protein
VNFYVVRDVTKAQSDQVNWKGDSLRSLVGILPLPYTSILVF